MTPRQILIDLIRQHGRPLTREPQRCEALLKDLCGAHRREIHGIVCAVREKIPVDLLSAGTEPVAVLYPRLAQRLHDNLGLDETLAVWAVETWAMALGMPELPPTARQPSSPKPTAASPGTPSRQEKAEVQDTVIIANLAYKIKDPDSQMPEMTWRFTARSTFSVPVRIFYKIRFLDVDGFQQKSTCDYLKLSPRKERAVTNDLLLYRAEAEAISRAEFEWEPAT
jgi:hypothetical protein